MVAVSDTGVDTDNCYFWDANHGGPTQYRDESHRKIVQYKNFVDKSDYKYGHGVHTEVVNLSRR